MLEKEKEFIINCSKIFYKFKEKSMFDNYPGCLTSMFIGGANPSTTNGKMFCEFTNEESETIEVGIEDGSTKEEIEKAMYVDIKEQRELEHDPRSFFV